MSVYCCDDCKPRRHGNKSRREKHIKETRVAYKRWGIFERDGFRCYLCESDLDISSDWCAYNPNPLYPTIDHIIPLSKGGQILPIMSLLVVGNVITLREILFYQR